MNQPGSHVGTGEISTIDTEYKYTRYDLHIYIYICIDYIYMYIYIYVCYGLYI